MKRSVLRASWLIALLALAAVPAAWAHYPFLRYTTASSPYQAAPAKFDLDALPGGIVQYFIDPSGLSALAPGDSLDALLSEIHLAASTWDQIPTSRLRLRFGGQSSAAPQSRARIDIVFQDLPPGVIAMGGPVQSSDVVERDGETFVPIQRSLLVLGKDLRGQPSWSDDFFLTLVHELGHALGLQHTFTSSAMSTAATRATTKASPLAQDDIAGISALYPTESFRRRHGVIRGRVTIGGVGVHLASVVALGASGGAVSAFTRPDGEYEITGLPPGLYFLYAHSLPPAVQTDLGPGDVVLPVDPGGKPVLAGPLFETVFYPGVKSAWQATVISVSAGDAVTGIDFEVQPRAEWRIQAVRTYGCPGAYCLAPAYVNRNSDRNYLLAWGQNLTANGEIAPGLEVEAIGGASVILSEKTKVYLPFGPDGDAYLQLYLWHYPLSGLGGRHLVFRFGDDLYVLPSAVHITNTQPPSITSVEPKVDDQGRLLASIRGSNLTPFTRILFDGSAAQQVNFDWDSGELTVLAPPGPPGRRAPVTALDPSGQTSMFLDANSPLESRSFVYPDGEQLRLKRLTPSALQAGAEAMIEIEAEGSSCFDPTGTKVGFGSSDITVRRIWVVEPCRLLANVSVAPQAATATVPLDLTSGSARATFSSALQILPVGVGLISVDPDLINPDTGGHSVYSGGPAQIRLNGLTASGNADVSITVQDISTAVTEASQGHITFRIPDGIPTGPAVLRVTLQGLALAPVVIQIDPPPPQILRITTPNGFEFTASSPARVGDLLVLAVAGLSPADQAPDPNSVTVWIGGVEHTPFWTDTRAGNISYVWVLLDHRVTGGEAVPITVAAGERISKPASIPIGTQQP